MGHVRIEVEGVQLVPVGPLHGKRVWLGMFHVQPVHRAESVAWVVSVQPNRILGHLYLRFGNFLAGSGVQIVPDHATSPGVSRGS